MPSINKGDKMVWSSQWTQSMKQSMYDSKETTLVFECDRCLKEFNIDTTSFQKLYDAARASNWVVIWLNEGYTVHCPDCRK
jgi:hypothetical protein